MGSISPADTLKRENVIQTRLKQALGGQQERLFMYLRLLDQMEKSIRAEDEDRLEAQVDVERSLVAEIYSLQRVIDAWNQLSNGACLSTDTLNRLKESIEDLREQAVRKSRDNCRLLEECRRALRRRIQGLSAAMAVSSPFARIGNPALVDISL